MTIYKSLTNMELTEKILHLEKLERDVREHIIANFESSIIKMVNDLHERITQLEKKVYGIKEDKRKDYEV